MISESKSKTLDEYELVSGKDADGKPVFSVLVKRTYSIIPGKQLVRAHKTFPLVKIDKYYEGGNPLEASIQFESDLAPYKPATDIIILAKAYAPLHAPCQQMDIGIEIGSMQKSIHVIGNRLCKHRSMRDPVFTDPEEFRTMDIRYENAYGGKDVKSNTEAPFFYPRNIIGKGVAIKNTADVINDLALPNFEDPDDLLIPARVVLGKPEHWADQPLPQGTGYFHPMWYPRSCFAGSVPGNIRVDYLTKEERLGFVPHNHIILSRQFTLPVFDVRFNCGASPWLIMPHVRENESIRLVNMSDTGELQFCLPSDVPFVMLDIGFGENTLTAAMHTVCIRVEDMAVDIVWRFGHEYPGYEWLPDMKKLNIEVA